MNKFRYEAFDPLDAEVFRERDTAWGIPRRWGEELYPVGPDLVGGEGHPSRLLVWMRSEGKLVYCCEACWARRLVDLEEAFGETVTW